MAPLTPLTWTDEQYHLSHECSPMAGLKTIFKAQKKDSLEGEPPSDDAYLLAQDSESSSPPPLQEDNEALAMLQESLR
jgi:hypothetical protein